MRYNELIENDESDDDLFGNIKDIRFVNFKSIELDGLDYSDFPDFADAYVSHAEWKNGEWLSDDELAWLTDELQDSGELNSMAHNSLYEDADASDEELFGTPVHKTIGNWLANFANTMRSNPAEISGLGPEDGQEYENDLEDIREEAKVVKFVAAAFEKQGLVPGLQAWIKYSGDWWENIESQLEQDTGIVLWQLFDQYDDQLQENTESDDELFADPYKPMSQALDFLNDHDYDELIELGFQFGSGNNDVDILNDYISDAETPIEVTNIRMNPDNEDDPLVSVRSRSLGEDDASDDDLFGRTKMYYANIMGNYNTGRYSDYGARKYIIPGSSPEDAMRWLERNEEWVYMYMDTQKFVSGKRVVRRPAKSNIFIDKSTIAGEAPEGSNSAIANFMRKHRAV